MDSASSPKKKRRGGPRRRTGCYTCKRRHTRCDERKPICGNCERLDFSCEQSGDTTWTITQSDPSPDRSEDNGSMLLDVFRSRISNLEILPHKPSDQIDTRDMLLISPVAISTSTVNEGITLTPETAYLLRTYVRTVATWMDVFDHSSTYQFKVPQLLMSSPLLIHSVCAFTANFLALSNSSHNSSWHLVAVKHYGEALRLLIEALSMPSHEHALTASMMLLSYEIHEALRSEDYKRHFLGLTEMIRTRRISAQSVGTDRANFWIYVRHDIVTAMASSEQLSLDPDEWDVCWEENETREDVLGNHILWILARVINLIFGENGTSEAGRIERQDFLLELELWRSGLSDTFVGIPYGDKCDDGFQKVYFPVTAAATAAFWYHIVHILLYAEPTLQDESYIPLIQEQAKQVYRVNIAISDFPAALMVFATHGLFYAAKHIHGISRKARVWTALNEVEMHTGYNTRNTIRQLQALLEQDLGC